MAGRPLSESGRGQSSVKLPAPTAFPMVLAFGLALTFAGLVTSPPVGVLGVLISIAGIVGWFGNVLPEQLHESVPVADAAPVVATTHREVAHMAAGRASPRAWLPLEIYPISAGIKGGLAGSVAMAVLAMLYGVISGRTIWYPINLLVAGFFPDSNTRAAAQISAFHPAALSIAVAIHLTTSLLVGLLYGAMLPMFPRRPVLLGGLIAPLIWSGLIYTTLGVINPALNQLINWPWFVLSQFGFGILAGLVVSRQERIRTLQQAPFAVRAGLEAPGVEEPTS